MLETRLDKHRKEMIAKLEEKRDHRRIYDWGWVSLACFGKPWRARSRLYRSHILHVNTRWKALAEIYTMHSFAPFSNLKISAKNHQHFFAIAY